MRNIPRESEELFSEMARTIPPEKYPPPIAPVPSLLPGVCFFPGAAGVWGNAGDYAPFPSGGAMIVGQDWGTVADYSECENAWVEPCESTWDNLLSFMRETGLPEEKCFFTNFFTGLRKNPPSIGEFPGAKDEKYVARCGEFFLQQIEKARPRLLVLLGLQTPRRIAALSEELKSWRGCETIKSLDGAGALKENIRLGGHIVRAACWLVHPSYRNRNAHHRRYKNKTGDAAEKELMREAIRISGINQ